MAGGEPPLLAGLKAWGSLVTRSSGGPGTLVVVLFSQWELNRRVADASGKGGGPTDPPSPAGLKAWGSSVTRSSGGPGTVVFVLFSQSELNLRVADTSGKEGFQRGGPPPFLRS